jgi:hypothetical protein
MLVHAVETEYATATPYVQSQSDLFRFSSMGSSRRFLKISELRSLSLDSCADGIFLLSLRPWNKCRKRLPNFDRTKNTWVRDIHLCIVPF